MRNATLASWAVCAAICLLALSPGRGQRYDAAWRELVAFRSSHHLLDARVHAADCASANVKVIDSVAAVLRRSRQHALVVRYDVAAVRRLNSDPGTTIDTMRVDSLLEHTTRGLYASCPRLLTFDLPIAATNARRCAACVDTLTPRVRGTPAMADGDAGSGPVHLALTRRLRGKRCAQDTIPARFASLYSPNHGLPAAIDRDRAGAAAFVGSRAQADPGGPGITHLLNPQYLQAARGDSGLRWILDGSVLPAVQRVRGEFGGETVRNAGWRLEQAADGARRDVSLLGLPVNYRLVMLAGPAALLALLAYVACLLDAVRRTPFGSRDLGNSGWAPVLDTPARHLANAVGLVALPVTAALLATYQSWNVATGTERIVSGATSGLVVIAAGSVAALAHRARRP